MYYALLLVFPTVKCCVCQHSIKALLTYLLTLLLFQAPHRLVPGIKGAASIWKEYHILVGLVQYLAICGQEPHIPSGNAQPLFGDSAGPTTRTNQ